MGAALEAARGSSFRYENKVRRSESDGACELTRRDDERERKEEEEAFDCAIKSTRDPV